MGLLKILTAIATGTLVLVLAFPAAAHRPLSPNRSKHTSSASRAGAGAPVPAEGDQIYYAPFGTTPIFTRHYIYYPAPPTPPQPYVDPNECEDNGTNCTDAQLCEFWGENCDSKSQGNAPSEASAEGLQSGS